MSLVVSQGSNKNFETIPEGTYIARCFKIIDLGTQADEWKGERKLKHKVVITWEILDGPRMGDGQPFAITRRYTASLHEKAQLRKDLEAWRGRRFSDEELSKFELTNVLGAYCMLQVVHADGRDGETYANVNAIMATKARPAGVNEAVSFDVDNPDMNLFDSFSDRLKELITSSMEWQERTAVLNKVAPAAAKPKLDEIVPYNGDEEINLEDIPF